MPINKKPKIKPDVDNHTGRLNDGIKAVIVVMTPNNMMGTTKQSDISIPLVITIRYMRWNNYVSISWISCLCSVYAKQVDPTDRSATA